MDQTTQEQATQEQTAENPHKRVAYRALQQIESALRILHKPDIDAVDLGVAWQRLLEATDIVGQYALVPTGAPPRAGDGGGGDDWDEDDA